MVWILNQHSKRSGSVSLDKWLSPHWTGGSAAKEYSITKANYYYRLKCVRQACLDAIPDLPTGFVELPAPPDTLPVPENMLDAPSVSAVIHTRNGVSIELYDSASADFMQKLLGVTACAE